MEYERPKCDFKGCKKRATYSIELMWHRYEIDTEGRHIPDKEWSADEHNSYCEEHAKIEGIL